MNAPLSLNEVLERLRATAAGAWQRRWIGLTVAAVVGAIAAIAVARFPERYEATARVYVDTQSVLKPLMTGLAVQPDIDKMVAMLGRTLVARPNIEKLVKDPKVGFEVGGPKDFEQLVTVLLSDVKLSSIGQNLFALSYRDTDAVRAQRVIETMVRMFVSTGRDDKKKDTEDARRFIDTQISAYETKLAEAESRLKDFKLRNFGYAGASGQDAFARMSSIQDELSRARLDLRAATESREALRRQLTSETPQMAADTLPAVPGMPVVLSEVDARLDAMRKQLDDLLRRYTEAHPDVTNTRRLIAQLEEQKRKDDDARARNGTARAAGLQSNPVFQRLRIELAQSEAQAAAAQARSSELQSRLDQLRAVATKYPQVEAELAQLNRDYEIIRTNYQALVTRREAASISKDVDDNAMLADFRIIEPPHTLPRPVMPNRLILAVIGLVVSLGAGFGAALGLTQLKPTVHNVRQLADIARRPVLGAISSFATAPAGPVWRMHAMFFSGVGSIVLAYAAWIGWLAYTSATVPG